MKLVKATGTTAKARRFLSSPQSVSEEEVKDPRKLAELMRGLMLRTADLEASTPPEAIEFEVDVSAGTTGVGGVPSLTRLTHNFGGPVRYYVTQWTHANSGLSPVYAPALARDDTSTADVLVLRSWVAGKAVIRVERAQADIDPGINGGDGTLASGGGTDASALTTGVVAEARGGLGTDVSALTGLLKNALGVASAVTAPSGAVVGDTDTQTLTNKTIVAASNTITDTSAAAGDILQHDGTRFVRLGVGTSGYLLTAGVSTVTWAAPPAAAVPLSSLFASIVNNAKGGHTTNTLNETHGFRFFIYSNKTLTGVRLYSGSAGNGRSFKVQVWDSGGTSLGNATAAAGSNNQIFTVSFSSPISLTAASSNTDYHQVSVFCTTTSYNVLANGLIGGAWPASTGLPAIIGVDVAFKAFTWATGDACPTNVIASEAYACEPVFA